MPRPDQSEERRRQLAPVLARTFADLGYRRTTTAELARRCAVQETILYRLWPDKRAMFIAALEDVYRLSEEVWSRLLQNADDESSSAERILEYEATHHGEFGLYRILFAGLSESDDRAIKAALKRLYGRFHSFVSEQVAAHRGPRCRQAAPNAEVAAWAILGLGTAANLGRELGLMSGAARKHLFQQAGRLLLEGGAQTASSRGG